MQAMILVKPLYVSELLRDEATRYVLAILRKNGADSEARRIACSACGHAQRYYLPPGATTVECKGCERTMGPLEVGP